MTVNEVAEFLRVSPRHVHNLIERGLVPVTRLGRRVVIEQSKLIKALDRLTVEAPEGAR
jgi:excisionase family DNA binding protein